MINFHQSGQILYIATRDVSIGNGPGVNEREFILALHAAIGDRAHFLIPQPVDKVPELPVSACTFSLPHRHYNPRYFPGHVLSQIRLADEILSRRQFDLLLFRLDVLPFAPFYITRKHQVPYALKTLSPALMWALSKRGGWLGRSLEGINRWLIRQLVAKALVSDACSVAQVEYFQRVPGVNSQKIVWIDNAVNPSRFFPSSIVEARRELGLTKFKPIVGYIGGFPSEFGARQLIEVAPCLVSKYPNLGLLIVGNGPGLSDLKKQADELQIGNHCVFTGYVPFDEVPVCANALDVGVSFLQPKHSAASEQKVRQYLACGKPVVVSPGANDYFLTSSNLGSIVQAADLEGIAAELDRWLSLTPDERGEFARRASEYARDNLSVEVALARRFEVWAERLQNEQRRPCE